MCGIVNHKDYIFYSFMKELFHLSFILSCNIFNFMQRYAWKLANVGKSAFFKLYLLKAIYESKVNYIYILDCHMLKIPEIHVLLVIIVQHFQKNI